MSVNPKKTRSKKKKKKKQNIIGDSAMAAQAGIAAMMTSMAGKAKVNKKKGSKKFPKRPAPTKPSQTTADVQNQIQILTKRKASAVHEDDYERAEAIKKEISALRAQLEKGKDDGTTESSESYFSSEEEIEFNKKMQSKVTLKSQFENGEITLQQYQMAGGIIPLSQECAQVQRAYERLGNQILCIAIALYEYEPQQIDELHLKEGDKIVVVAKMEDGYWEGLFGDKQGLFPGNFVLPIEYAKEEPKPRISQKSSKQKPKPPPKKESPVAVIKPKPKPPPKKESPVAVIKPKPKPPPKKESPKPPPKKELPVAVIKPKPKPPPKKESPKPPPKKPPHATSPVAKSKPKLPPKKESPKPPPKKPPHATSPVAKPKPKPPPKKESPKPPPKKSPHATSPVAKPKDTKKAKPLPPKKAALKIRTPQEIIRAKLNQEIIRAKPPKKRPPKKPVVAAPKLPPKKPSAKATAHKNKAKSGGPTPPPKSAKSKQHLQMTRTASGSVLTKPPPVPRKRSDNKAPHNYRVGMMLVLKGTGEKWEGATYIAEIVDICGPDEEPIKANTIKVKYEDGGFRRFKKTDFDYYVVEKVKSKPKASSAVKSPTNASKPPVATATRKSSLGDRFPTESQMRMSGLIKDRRWLFHTWKQCFVGSEVVKWMVSVGLAQTPKKAVKLGKAMVKQKKIHHLGYKKYPFQNAFVFYRWKGSKYYKPKPYEPPSNSSGSDGIIFSASISKHHCPMVDEPIYPFGLLPKLVVHLWDEIEAKGGLKLADVFRVTPNRNAVNIAKKRLEKMIVRKADYTRKDASDALIGVDVHVICELFKSWFRYLSPKLLDDLSKETLITEEDQVQEVVDALKEPQHSVLLWLLDRMHQITSFNEQNKLTVKSFAVMLAPTLYSDIESCLIVIAFLQHAVSWRQHSLHESSFMIRKEIRKSLRVTGVEEVFASTSDSYESTYETGTDSD